MTFRHATRRAYSRTLATTALVALATSLALVAPVVAQPTRAQVDLSTFPFRDLTKELANKMTGTYTVAVVGDVLLQEAVTGLIDPKLQKILQDADTTVGNMEFYLVDRRNWPYGHGNNWAPKELAKGIADLGFDLLGPGEAQGGEEGMKSSIKYLDEVGIQVAGYGPNLSTARMPAFQHTPKGTVGMIAAYPGHPTIDRSEIAQNRNGNSGKDTWGMNPLRLTQWHVVTPEMLQQLTSWRDAIVARRTEPGLSRPIDVPRDEPNRVRVFDTNFMTGPKPGEFHWEINPTDLESQTLAVRNAKEYGDFVIFGMHVHQNRFAFQAYSQENYATDFEIEITHKLVDNGMDLYAGSGVHTMKGIEIYKGRPIFYNPGNFAVARYGSDDSPVGTRMTDIEAGEVGNAWLQGDNNLVCYIAVAKYQDGKLAEVRVYPVDLGVGRSRPVSRMSIAQTPTPALARTILEQVQKYSEPYGTKMVIDNGVGIITVPPEATVAIGADIRSTFGESRRPRP